MYLLDRVQRQLWVEYDWPLRTVKLEIRATQRDQNFIDYPTGISYEGVQSVYVRRGNGWYKLEFGITPEDYLRVAPSHVLRWDHHQPDNKMELWPHATATDVFMVKGVLDCPRMALATDRCVLDDTLIVLRAAAEIATRQKMADAKTKMDDAARFAGKLLGKQAGGKADPFVYGGGEMHSQKRLRPGLDYIPS
jgi:hypothetical protein